jgi:hypothetical protein
MPKNAESLEISTLEDGRWLQWRAGQRRTCDDKSPFSFKVKAILRGGSKICIVRSFAPYTSSALGQPSNMV